MPQDLAFLDTLLHADSRRALIDHTSRWLDGLGFHCFLYAEHRPVRADGKRARFVFDGIDGSAAAGAARHRLSTLPPAWRAIIARPVTRRWIRSCGTRPRRACRCRGTGAARTVRRRRGCSPKRASMAAGGIVVPLRGAHGATALLNAATAHDGEAARRRLDSRRARDLARPLPARSGAPPVTTAGPARRPDRARAAMHGALPRAAPRARSAASSASASAPPSSTANAARKLGARNRREAVARAITAGLAVP